MAEKKPTLIEGQPQLMDRKIATLTLGWRIDRRTRLIKGWTPNGVNGSVSSETTFQVPANACKKHHLIVARSGAGKSYAVGRFLEELLRNTKARVLILDPNSDYSRLDEKDGRAFESPRYVPGTRCHLPTEDDIESFWKKYDEKALPCKKITFSNRTDFFIPVPKLTNYTISTANASSAENELCSRLLIRLSEWEVAKDSSTSMEEILEELNRVFRLPNDDVKTHLKERYKAIYEETEKYVNNSANNAKPDIGARNEEYRNTLNSIDQLGELFDVVKRAMSATTFHSFFATIATLIADGLLYPQEVTYLPSHRLTILDLPTIPDRYRYLFSYFLIERELDYAYKQWTSLSQGKTTDDQRVPLYVVIDEAHNLIPRDHAALEGANAVRSLIRKIAAEGRKYGVFLVLVTQRPDKLDATVLSECENILSLSIASPDLLQEISRGWGADSDRICMDIMGLDPGYAIAVGPWVTTSEPYVPFYCAARRTASGGSDLNDGWCEDLD